MEVEKILVFRPWSYLWIVVLIAFLATVLRLAKDLYRPALNAIIGLSALGICLTLNSQPIYSAIDPLLGGRNRIYLAVQVTYILAMFFLMTTFVPAKSIYGYGALQSFLCITAITLVCTFFALACLPVSVYRVEIYRNEWQVIAFTQIVNLYSAWAATRVIGTLYRTLAYSKHLSKSKKTAYIFIVTAFVAGLLTVLERVILQGLTTHSESSGLLGILDGVLVLASLAGLTAGFLLLFITRPRHVVFRKKPADMPEVPDLLRFKTAGRSRKSSHVEK